MGFNHMGKLNLEGNQPVRISVSFNGQDLGAQYIAANPIGTFISKGVLSNSGAVTLLDQGKQTIFGAGGTTVYFVTVRNDNSSGVTVDFDGGGF